ncbi:MAG: hypothetical protein U0X86_000064 [Wolbachia endosymbiont of Xenopsylla cheopis]
MSDKCPMKATLKLDRGRELDCDQYSHRCSTVTLKSMDDEVIGTYSPYRYYFNEEGSLAYRNNANKENVTLGKGLLLKVEKNAQGELELAIYRKDGSKVHDLEVSSIKGFRNIDFEQYLNAKEPQIYIKGDNFSSYRVVLYDTKDNEIGVFVDTNAILSDDQLIVLDYRLSTSFYDDKVNAIMDKIDGYYQFYYQKGDRNYLQTDIENININYNVLDKIMIAEQDKDNPYCQIEALNREKEKLCKNLDETSMALSGQHHPCISELAKANFAIEPATYDIGTYM